MLTRTQLSTCLITALSITMSLLLATGLSAQDTTTAIEVGNQTIPKSTIQHRIDKQMKRLKARGGAKLKKNPQMKKRLKKKIKQNVIKQMVDKLVLLEHAERAGITVDDTEVDKQYSNMKKQFSNDKKFEEMLSGAGTTEGDLKEKLKGTLKIKKFVEQKTSRVEVSDKDARKYYEKNSKRFGKRSFKELKPKIIQMLERKKRSQQVQQLVSKLKKETTINVRI